MNNDHLGKVSGNPDINLVPNLEQLALASPGIIIIIIIIIITCPPWTKK